MRFLQFDPNECASADSCFKSIKILAPIYQEHSICSINWNTSSYLEDQNPWKYASMPDVNMIITPAVQSRGIYLKVSIVSSCIAATRHKYANVVKGECLATIFSYDVGQWISDSA